MMRPILMAVVVLGAGCFQITGVSDYKVEEACAIPAGSPCRVAPNCGCPGNETCELLNASGAGTCKPAGDRPKDSPCTLNSECSKGLACIDGSCQPLCAKNEDCGGGGTCSGITYQGTPVTGVGVCSVPCDPFGNSCPSGRACRFTTDGGTSCFPSAGGRDGDTCTDDLACGPGLVCGDAGVCTPICEAPSSCPTGGECQPTALTYQGRTYGFCPRGG
jgi:hypothetical protein